MNMWEAIVLIVIVTSLARVMRARFRGPGHGHGGDFPPRMAQPADEGLRREVEELRERVKVLERIITDQRHSRDLAEEIEKLR